MLDQGQPGGLEVFWPVEIYGQWHTLSATASTWAAESAAAAEQMEQAAGSWTGLVSSYREAETQEIVRTALDEAPGVTREWAGVVGSAADVLQSFATEANGLQQQATALEGQATRLQARLWASNLLSGGGDDDTSAEDAALRSEIDVHNSDVMTLNSRWQQLEQQTASEIDSIASGGGYQDQIPIINTDGAGFGPGGFGAGGSLAGGALAGAALAGGSLNGGAGLGLAFQSALGQMIRNGNVSGDGDPVETAQDLFDQVIVEGARGEDVQKFRDQIASMEASEIREFSEQTPAVHENSVSQPRSGEQYQDWPSGEDGHKWWTELDDRGTQATVAKFLPLLVGNVQGLSNSTRDTANRKALTKLRNNDDYQGWDKNLAQIERSLGAESEEDMDGQDRPSDDPPRMLLSLDIGQREDLNSSGPSESVSSGVWERQPLAAVSVGDPDTADTTSFGVSGMSSGTHDMQNEVRFSEQLHRDLEREDESSHAVVSWVGYDPPPEWSLFDHPTSVLRNDRASVGGWDFAYALDGFQESRVAGGDEWDEFKVKVHAQSYGTNMSAHAVTRLDHEIDAVAFYGSSGIPESVAEHASDFDKVATDGDGKPMLFASESYQDNTAFGGRTDFVWGSNRIDPTRDEFGAQEYYSGHQHDGDATNLDDVTGHYRAGEEPGESGYLDRGTMHYRNLTHILSGNHQDVLTTEEYIEDWVPMEDVLQDHDRGSSGP